MNKNKLLLTSFIIVLFFWQIELILQVIAFIFSILSPFIIAAAIAFIINIPMTAIEKTVFDRKNTKKKIQPRLARIISLFVAILFFIAIIIFVLLFIIPQLQSTIASLAIQLERFLPNLFDNITILFNNNPEIEEFLLTLNFDELKESFIQFLKTGFMNVFDGTINFASSIISTLTTVFVAIVFALYILIGKETLARQFTKVIKTFFETTKAERIITVLSLTKKTFASFVTGQCLEGIILGFLFVIILPLFKIPFSLLIGVIVGISSLVPILGAFVGAGVGTFIILIEDPILAIYFIIIFLVIQQLEGNLIYPHVVGDSIGLPGMWVLAAVSVGSAFMGVLGILLFIPLTSVAYALFKEYVNTKLEAKKHLRSNKIR